MNVLIPVADGSEEMETVILVDVLRRAGADVRLASVMENGRCEIQASRQVRLIADCHIDDISDQIFDLIALPGGLPGAEHLANCHTLIALLQQQKQAGRLFAAVCAAPALVLARHGLIDGPATAHPAFIDQLPEPCPGHRVVEDGQCITSQSPGTSIEFALTLVTRLYGQDKRAELAEQMLAH